MKRVVITGMGWINSIGNSQAEVLHSLKNGISGISVNPDFSGPECPVKLAGVPKGFHFPSTDVEDWIYPKTVPITREQLRSMSPNALYGFFAMREAIQNASLPPELVSNPRTGTLCASAGSVWISYENAHILANKGALRCNPMCVVSSIPGTLNINIAACYKIKGSSLGFASACASSSHAIGHGTNLIRLGRQDIIFAVGAEDCSKFTIQPFAAVRALSSKTDPRTTPCAFDAGRDGFVACGGATALVLEEFEHAKKRGATIYAEIIGWGESADGYNVMAPEPEGEGLSRSMANALQDSNLLPDQVDYINAHATATPAGDIAEIKAIKRIFTGKRPFVSSTKSLTGHGLSLAGALEAGICALSIHEGFIPVSANITRLDPACEGVPIVTHPIDSKPSIVMSNSSGFGGTNVSLVFKKL